MLAVYTDTQNLGIYPVEPVEGDLVRRDLGSSDGSPGQGEESQEDVLLAQVITQTGDFAQMIFQSKTGRDLSNSQCHSSLLFMNKEHRYV
jgi:hypothetical protein